MKNLLFIAAFVILLSGCYTSPIVVHTPRKINIDTYYYMYPIRPFYMRPHYAHNRVVIIDKHDKYKPKGYTRDRNIRDHRRK